jgi:thiol-disulfide isomerase/thioredoxin
LKNDGAAIYKNKKWCSDKIDSSLADEVAFLKENWPRITLDEILEEDIIVDPKGRTMKIFDVKQNSVVCLYFGADWCPACRQV